MRFITTSSYPLHALKPPTMYESCERYGIPIQCEIMGYEKSGKAWMKREIELLQAMPYDEIVLLTDGTDAFFCANEQEIERRFLEFDRQIVFSAETNYWPKETPQYGEYPTAPTRYRYINGGGRICRAGPMLEMLTHPDFWPADSWVNQMAYHEWWMRGRGGIALDHHQRIFCVIHGNDPASFPCVVHCPGGGQWRAWELWQGMTGKTEHRSSRRDSLVARRRDILSRR